MKEYTIKKEDLTFIQRLIKITKSIESLYDKLYNLDIAGKKDTEEYNKILDNLDISLDVESEIYIEKEVDIERYKGIIKYIKNDMLPYFYKSDLENIASQDYSYMALRRIIKTLETQLRHKIDESCTNIEIDENSEIGVIFDVIKPYGYKMEDIYHFEMPIEKDVMSGTLLFLEEAINDEKNKSITNALKRAKYNITFLNREIESVMLWRKFEPNNKLFLNSDMIMEIYGYDAYKTNVLKNMFGMAKINGQIKKLLKIDNEDYSDYKKLSTSKIRECLLRGISLLMDEKIIKQIVEKYEKEFWVNRNYYGKNNLISYQVVLDSLKHNEIDKEKLIKETEKTKI